MILVSCLVLFAFGIMLLRHPVELAYLALAWFPLLTFLIAVAHESVTGIHQFNHQMLHVAYDSSYTLLLLGICLVLRGVIRRREIKAVLAATILAGIPLGHIYLTAP